MDEQIGSRLRRAREAAGLTVDDVIFRAHLPRSVIEALEAEDFSVFTSTTYAKSFLLQYSGFLNVDATPWINALEPATYLHGKELRPLLENRPAARQQPVVPVKSGGNGGFSTFLMMLISGGLIFGAYKAFQILDAKNSDSVDPVRDPEITIRRDVPSKLPANPVAPKALPIGEAEPKTEPSTEAVKKSPDDRPRRAIIVRE